MKTLAIRNFDGEFWLCPVVDSLNLDICQNLEKDTPRRMIQQLIEAEVCQLWNWIWSEQFNRATNFLKY